jgi:hypothetical protein
VSLHQKISFKKIGVLSPQTRFLPFGLLKIHLSTVKVRIEDIAKNVSEEVYNKIILTIQ